MKTFLKYAFPVLASMAFQAFILVTLRAKTGWEWGRIGLFLLVDVLIGLIQWSRFDHERRRQYVLLRRQIGKRLGLELD
jgi:hypothetical protein